ncbi:putative bifunctional diguanylate cyclase/phosphodiesterase [Nitrincola sp. MINF-07-Sa-05]|uniref:putative bifunctional diguanylate cyclase/phosphodiesterase n=1 Tax=Nitrincola salilacus TaxID=3400273 RepID=UPI003917E666
MSTRGISRGIQHKLIVAVAVSSLGTAFLVGLLTTYILFFSSAHASILAGQVEVMGFMALMPLLTSGSYMGLLMLVVLSMALLTLFMIRPLTRQLRSAAEQLDVITASHERIHELSNYDQLTGLPNWRSLYDQLNLAIDARSDYHQEQVALLFMNLDRFKVINESLGHAAGDQLLIEVANRLKCCLGEQDVLARAAGDEFLILTRVKDRARIEQLASDILAHLHAPFSIAGHQLYVAATIGISVSPDHGEDTDLLLKHADTAMIKAKAQGRNSYQFYSPEMSVISQERFTLEHDLRHAISRGELELHYQAQVLFDEGVPGGVEALLRWHHPTRGMVPPDQFIPLAEESGLINEIGLWVLQQACQQARQWLDSGYPIRVSVNLSCIQLQQDNIVELVRDTLRQASLPACYLELELTESCLLKDFERSARSLRKLRLLGVSLAMDDFGTGYSSLSYLKRLRLHRLKIDRSFVTGLPADQGDLAIVSTIVAMARSLGLEVVAEGVETEQQRISLSQLGCDEYQGYLFSKPLSAGDFGQRFLTAAQVQLSS